MSVNNLGNNNHTYNVVIARYKENLDWINNMNKSNIIIYNKSEEIIENSISRPNIGRDPETFLYHIIENYDNLPDYLIFLQGDPFPHSTINKDNIQVMIDEVINRGNITVTPFFCNIHEEVWFFPGLNIPQYHNFLFSGDSIIQNIYFASGCQYIVSKENILYRPKAFYRYIYNMICTTNIIDETQAHFGNNIFDITHMSGWTLERFFFYIFNKKELSDEIKQII